jgi:hypothetical protein
MRQAQPTLNHPTEIRHERRRGLKVAELRELFRQRTAEYFQGYEVVFANQSRTAKPSIPLVTLTFHNVQRPHTPLYVMKDGCPIGHYFSKIIVTIDLFTNGKPVTDNTGLVVYENTAMDELLHFCDYLNGYVTLNWCNANNITILIEQEAQDLTGIVNDNNYEYRARQDISLYFIHKADPGVDYSGYFTWANIEYDILKPEKGEP